MDLSHLDADFALIDDDQEAVRVRWPGEPFSFAVAHAIQRPVTRREMEASQGLYQAHDVQFTLYGAECERSPVPGCLILLPAGSDGSRDETQPPKCDEFTVLQARLESAGSVWVCIARNLVITERLDTLITIQEGNFQKSQGGADEADWTDLYVGVRARIQPENSRQQIQHGQRRIKRQFRVFVREMFTLRRQHRIVDSAGRLYRVTGFEQPERIDRLTEITCEEW